MFRFALLACLCAAAFAQTAAPPAEKPPADVDHALRARVDQFYSFLKNKEYRKVETLITEDTKDYYYEGSKPDISRFDIQDIQYSEQFTRAAVITRCAEKVAVPGFPVGDMELKSQTTWRLENGDWYYYVDQTKIPSLMASPGKRAPAAPAPAGARATTPPGLPPEMPTDAGFIFGKVQADKPTVRLAAGATERVTITNGARGPVSLELGYPVKGIEAKLNRIDLGGGEKAVLTLKAGEEPTGGIFALRIMPTGEILKIAIEVK
jgi:hypothetical protein